MTLYRNPTTCISIPIVLLTASTQKRVSNMLTRVWSLWKLQVTFYTYFMFVFSRYHGNRSFSAQHWLTCCCPRTQTRYNWSVSVYTLLNIFVFLLVFRVLSIIRVRHHGEGEAPHQYCGNRTCRLGQVYHHWPPYLQVWGHWQENHREIWEGSCRGMTYIVGMMQNKSDQTT